MKSAVKLILFLPLLPVWPCAARSTLTAAESRTLAVAAMPREAKSRAVTIELDREQSGCAIYHAYGLIGEAPNFMTATLGWWSVDLRTGEVWTELSSQRVISAKITKMQQQVRRRLGVSDGEVSASIANPCYERYSK
jgi:hypothetical protein